MASELAAKEAEFNALQEQHQEETVRMEATLAWREVELEQMEVTKQMEIARARLIVYQEVEEAEENVDPLKMISYISLQPSQNPLINHP